MPFGLLLHHADCHNQAIGADFRNQRRFCIHLQAQELEGAVLRQILLEIARLRRHFAGLPGTTQQQQQ